MTGLGELDEGDIEDAIRRELEALDELDLKNLEGFSDAKYENTATDLSDAKTSETVGFCCMFLPENVAIS